MVHTHTAATPARTQHASRGPLLGGGGPCARVRLPTTSQVATMAQRAQTCVDLKWIYADRCASSRSARAGRMRTPLRVSALSVREPGTGRQFHRLMVAGGASVCCLTHSHTQAQRGSPCVPPYDQGGRASVIRRGLNSAANAMVCTQSIPPSQMGETVIAWTARDSRQHSWARADMRTST